MDSFDFDDGDVVVGDLPNFRASESSFQVDDGTETKRGSRARGNAETQEVPQRVKDFVQVLREAFRQHHIKEMSTLYEHILGKLTDKYFSNTRMPDWPKVAEYADDDRVFKLLYLQIYYRHIYAKLTPTFADHMQSYNNYCDLFDFFLSKRSLDFVLPRQWLWDIVDEFLWQFQTFSHWRCKLRQLSEGDINKLKSKPNVWSALSVIDYLEQLVSVSGIVDYLREQDGKGTSSTEGTSSSVSSASASASASSSSSSSAASVPSGFGDSKLHRLIGYYAIVGQLRVQTLLADYRMALEVLEPIDLTSKSGLFSENTACFVSLFYHTGFAYMMQRRYVDAITTFQQVLWYVTRTKQHHTKSMQYDNMMKKTDQMLSLLAICTTLTPFRLEEMLRTTLRDQYGDHMSAMAKGNLDTFGELFGFASPKFVNPVHLDYDAEKAKGGNSHQNLREYYNQKRLFLQDVEQQLCIPDIRGLLRLYTTLEVGRLGEFMGMQDEDIVNKTIEKLLTFKNKTHARVRTGKVAASGERQFCHDVGFFVEKDMLSVNQSVTVRQFGEFFLRNIHKYEKVAQEVAALE